MLKYRTEKIKNTELKRSKIGCHVANVCTNNFSFADDLVVLGPDAKSLNMLLKICDKVAEKFYIKFSTVKTEAMRILPQGAKYSKPPNIYLCGAIISYVKTFRYLGHVISSDFTDDEDIERETRNLYTRGNTIARKFGFLDVEIKYSLFKSYCYSLYTCSLWVRYNRTSMNKIRVAYNNVLRKLMKIPPRTSISNFFVTNDLRSFQENVRYINFSL